MLDFGDNCEAEAQKNLALIRCTNPSDIVCVIKERLILILKHTVWVYRTHSYLQTAAITNPDVAVPVPIYPRDHSPRNRADYNSKDRDRSYKKNPNKAYK